jgi:hypothetical protein
MLAAPHGCRDLDENEDAEELAVVAKTATAQVRRRNNRPVCSSKKRYTKKYRDEVFFCYFTPDVAWEDSPANFHQPNWHSSDDLNKKRADLIQFGWFGLKLTRDTSCGTTFTRYANYRTKTNRRCKLWD